MMERDIERDTERDREREREGGMERDRGGRESERDSGWGRRQR